MPTWNQSNRLNHSLHFSHVGAAHFEPNAGA
jgi:hypothetical protein